MFICDRGTGTQQFWGLVMSEIHRRRPRRYKFEFSFLGNDRRPSQKSGTRRENRNAPDSPDLSLSIPDDRGYLRFRFGLILIYRKKYSLSDLIGLTRKTVCGTDHISPVFFKYSLIQNLFVLRLVGFCFFFQNGKPCID